MEKKIQEAILAEREACERCCNGVGYSALDCSAAIRSRTLNQYSADPADHEAVARGLLVKYRDQQAGEMKFQVQELRPEVLAFALRMEQRLREKDAEHGGNSWQSASAKEIVIPTTAKALHLDSVVRDVHHLNLNPVKHAVDLANYCMMIADISGALEVPAQESAA